MDTSHALDALQALAHDTRLAAYRALVQAGTGGLSVGELRERLGVPPATPTGVHSHFTWAFGALAIASLWFGLRALLGL